MRPALSYLKRAFKNFFNLLFDNCLALVSPGFDKELARRDAERGHDTLRWFTRDEAAVAEALARVIVPSNEETPGINEVDVLDPPAIVTLDNLVATSPYRQHLYSRGLLSFDRWALKDHECKFVEMTEGDQIALFREAQQVYEKRTGVTSTVKKAWSRLQAITQARKGAFFAARLYPQIRSDCLQVFYTSRVSWIWLEYDGPPMEKGYPDVTAPRET